MFTGLDLESSEIEIAKLEAIGIIAVSKLGLAGSNQVYRASSQLTFCPISKNPCCRRPPPRGRE